MSKNFNQQQYAENEITLAKAILSTNPDDKLNMERLAYWSLKLGDMETAKKFAGDSPKINGLIADAERGINI
jgi:hypothetical protein